MHYESIRRVISLIFIALSLVLGVIFYSAIDLPSSLEAYFKKEYYTQFGPMAICVELLIAGFHLFIKHSKANFTLALFAFTALLDPFFNLTGLFSTQVPTYATILFLCCALLALWLVLSNPYKLQRISLTGFLLSFILGSIIEIFFNYL